MNLSSDLLGGLYNPFAAVPSLHFGYALLVGVTVALLAKGRVGRAIGWSYPAVMLLVIVATGNHFFLDAAGGALTIGIGYIAASWIDSPAKRSSSNAPLISHAHFTGTGTRTLQPNGKRAIEGLFARSF